MDPLLPLNPERGYADRTSYPPYYFSSPANDVSVVWEHELVSVRTLGDSSDAERDNAACLFKTIWADNNSNCVHCVMRHTQDLNFTETIPENMEMFFVLLGAGQMPLVCRSTDLTDGSYFFCNIHKLVSRESVSVPSDVCIGDCDIGKCLPPCESSQCCSLVITAANAGCSFRLAR